MKRVIKFRGKCVISGDWVYGDLIHGVGHKSGNMYILPNKINLAYVKHCDPLDGVKVIPETIGQFSGLIDKNKIEIFEDDIIQYTQHHFNTSMTKIKTKVVKWKYDKWSIYETTAGETNIEVIGNTIDTPELNNIKI